MDRWLVRKPLAPVSGNKRSVVEGSPPRKRPRRGKKQIDTSLNTFAENYQAATTAPDAAAADATAAGAAAAEATASTPVAPTLAAASVPPVHTTTSYYKKRSNTTTALQCSAVEDYRLALRWLTPPVPAWERLSQGDQALQKRWQRLTAGQRDTYWILVDLLHGYVGGTVGEEDFDDVMTPWVWNWATWHRVILKIAGSMPTRNLQSNTCWMSTLSTDRGGHCKLSVRPGRIEKRSDGNHSRRNIWDFYIVEGAASLETTTGRLITLLAHGPPTDTGAQASHLCHNEPQQCTNPGHLIWEDDGTNKSRNRCVFGAGFLCPHQPKCVWTDTTGRFLPHRNCTEWQATCDSKGACEGDCWTADIL